MLRNSAAPEEFAKPFLGRLKSMASTHELLSHSNWEGAGLRELVEATVRDQGSMRDAIDIDGPELTLMPNASATLGLVLYELATNAMKYGGLSSAGGRVQVRWRQHRSSDARVVLTWREFDGPRPAGTIEEGFGVHFVKNAVQFELQGSAAIHPDPAGVQWTIEFGAQGNVQEG